ncbi:MAG: hypothetical protein ACI7YS_15665 [Flavobacterium sp.]
MIAVSPEDYTTTNPYLRYDVLTPICTIFLPLFWTLIMGGLLLSSYLKKKADRYNSGVLEFTSYYKASQKWKVLC